MATKSFLFSEHIHLLGLRFLTKSQQTFENDVQSAMKGLVSSEQQKLAEKESTSFDLPTVLLQIPSTLDGDLEIVLEKAEDVARIEYDHLKESGDELLASEGEERRSSLQSYLTKLLSTQSINIAANQIFVYRGQLNTAEERCLAFTSQIALEKHCYYQCVILYAESPAKVTDIIETFKRLFTSEQQKTAAIISPKIAATSLPTTASSSSEPSHQIVMVAGVEIEEEVSEGKWATAPLDKEGFKLRSNLDKRICITLHQEMLYATFPAIKVERCFGMLLGPGRHQASSAMVAIGLNSMRK